ncbi:MAG: protein of unknown function transrane [Acidimicrobiales bacterium]|nr:protein of unknown function transrane [Acidimicrobiales bacterium]
MAALLALTSSLLWGTGDFLGGTMSRRVHPLAVMQASQGMALVAFAVAALVSGQLGAPLAYLPWGIGAGLAGVIGLWCFYTALATGTMGVVAPITACGVIVPVVVGIVGGESPGPLVVGGMVLAVVGIIMAAGPERGTVADPAHAEARVGPDRPRIPPAALAGLAALGFGCALLGVAHGSRHNVLMTLLTMRAVNVLVTTTLLLTVVRGAPRATRRDLPTLATVAMTDGSANAMYAIATTSALVSVTTVLASLYPAVTVVLAWRVHGERMRPVQVVGVLATLVGVIGVAGGSGA